MRYLLTIIVTGIALAIPVTSFCQPDTLFTRTYEDSYALGFLGLIQVNQGYVIGCEGFEIEENGIDFQLIKLDSLYEIEWRQYYHSGRNDNPVADVCYSVRHMPDGGYVLVGPTSGDGMLIRTDSDGEEIWRRFLIREDGLSVRLDCVVDIDGNIVVVGSNMAAKFSDENEGEEIWRQTYEGASNIHSIVALEEGGFAFTTYTSAFGAQGQDMYAARIDSEGEIIWQNSYGTEHTDWSKSIIQTTDGGFCLAGLTRDGGRENDHPLIIRLDSEGNELWQRYDEDGSGGIILSDVTETPDGGFVGVGYNPRQSGAYILVRTDYFGEVLWRVEWLARGDDDERGIGFGGFCYEILPMANGGYLLGGLDMHGDLEGVIIIGTEPDPVEIDFELELIGDSLDFGELKIDSTTMMDLPFTNIGRRYVVIDSLWFDGDSVFASPLEVPFRIDPLDTMFVPVNFTPSDDTTFSATMYLSYGDEQMLEVTLTGEGETPNSVRPDSRDIPLEFAITGIYPNPFNSTVRISFSLPEASLVKVGIFDIAGRQLEAYEQNMNIGRHHLTFKGEQKPAGLYIVKVNANGVTHVQKALLIK